MRRHRKEGLPWKKNKQHVDIDVGQCGLFMPQPSFHWGKPRRNRYVQLLCTTPFGDQKPHENWCIFARMNCVVDASKPAAGILPRCRHKWSYRSEELCPLRVQWRKVCASSCTFWWGILHWAGKVLQVFCWPVPGALFLWKLAAFLISVN